MTSTFDAMGGRTGDGPALLVRPARPDDIAEILALVRELADFEAAIEEVEADEKRMSAALFGVDPKVFALVAEVDGAVAGLAVWFFNFSTWLGSHGIYLEDLYVMPPYRGLGVGRALLVELSRTAVEAGCRRLDWWVLDWNDNAHGFYRSLGASPMEDWTVWRLSGPALQSLAGR